MGDFFCKMKDERLRKAFIDDCIKRNKVFFPEFEKYVLGNEILTHLDMLFKGEYYLDIPSLYQIEKDPSGEKRNLYLFKGKDGVMLAYMAFVLQRTYDYIFSEGLYSFRLNKNNALQQKNIAEVLSYPRYFAFKTDIKGYSKNIDQDVLVQKLEDVLGDDTELAAFFKWLIKRNRFYSKGKVIERNLAGIQGCALTGFFLNVYLMDIDEYFYDKCDFYCRFTDDILLVTYDEKKVYPFLIKLHDMALANHVELKKTKTEIFAPNERIEMLGMAFENGEVDISSATLNRIKTKMRINAKSAVIKNRRDKRPEEEVAAEYIKNTFNQFANKQDKANKTNWGKWFFPHITKDDGLRELDRYCRHCIRYILTEKWGKAQYRVKYSKLKSLGYISLVNLRHSYGKNFNGEKNYE